LADEITPLIFNGKSETTCNHSEQRMNDMRQIIMTNQPPIGDPNGKTEAPQRSGTRQLQLQLQTKGPSTYCRQA